MCMALVVSMPGWGLAATCTRFTQGFVGGHQRVWDLGGKMIQTPTGWAVSTGEVATLLAGLRVLSRTGIEEGRNGIRSLHEATRQRIAAEHPKSTPEKTAFLRLHAVATGCGVDEIRPDGTGMEFELGCRVLISWPPNVQADDSLIADLLTLDGLRCPPGEILGRQTSCAAVVKTVVSWFDHCSQIDDSMSPEIEIGLAHRGATHDEPSRRFASGHASDFASLSETETLRMFGPPPVRPPFPGHVAEEWAFGVLFDRDFITPEEVIIR